MGVDRVEIGIGRNDISVIALEERRLGDLLDGKSDVRLQQLREVTLMVGRKMNHHNEREAAILGYVFEKYLERRQSPRGRSDPYDGRFRFRWFLRGHWICHSR